MLLKTIISRHFRFIFHNLYDYTFRFIFDHFSNLRLDLHVFSELGRDRIPQRVEQSSRPVMGMRGVDVMGMENPGTKWRIGGKVVNSWS
jgi:hypothetical protein